MVKSTQAAPAVEHIAVYGTLRRDHGANRSMAECDIVGDTHNLQGFRMLSLGGFPGLVPMEGGSVVVEIYHLPEDRDTRRQVLQRLDAYEGAPSFYNRQIVEIHGVACFVYILTDPEKYATYDTVATGDWKNPVLIRKYAPEAEHA